MLRYLNTQVYTSEIPDELSLGFSILGCNIHCPNCHSQHVWDINSIGQGKELTHDELDKCISNKDYIPKVSEQDMQSLDEINNSYDKLSNPDTLKIDMIDITFEDINGVLEDYKKSPDSINTVGKSLVESQNVAEDCKKRVDKLVEKPDNASNEYFNQFKNAMYKTANLVIKISKGIIDTSVEMFKNYERILNIFINWGSNTESFYFEDKDILYLL